MSYNRRYGSRRMTMRNFDNTTGEPQLSNWFYYRILLGAELRAAFHAVEEASK